MKVKLIIWDLDDTLWSGTLAEGDTLHLSEFRTSVIKKSNKNGMSREPMTCSSNKRGTIRPKANWIAVLSLSRRWPLL